jgi:hypothetical protein
MIINARVHGGFSTGLSLLENSIEGTIIILSSTVKSGMLVVIKSFNIVLGRKAVREHLSTTVKYNDSKSWSKPIRGAIKYKTSNK